MVFQLMGFAATLGAKHSLDADHLAAVGAHMTSNDAKPAHSGLAWALGHMATAGALALCLWLFRESFAPWAQSFEILAPVVLVGSGAWGLLALFRDQRRKGPARAGHMAGIGALHGLASNDELLTVLVASLACTTLIEVAAAILAFTAGVTIGMVTYSYGIRIVARPLARTGQAASCLVSIVLGAWMAFQLVAKNTTG